MAVTSFIPTIWAAKVIQALQKILVSEVGVNHNYEGDVQFGSSVKINRLSDVTVKEYTGTDIEYDDLDTTDVTLNIDKQYYTAVKLDDVDKVQARDGGALMTEATNNMAYKIADKIDSDNFTEMVNGAGVKIGSDSAPVSVTDAETAKNLVLRMKTAADKANVPKDNRVMFAGPELENYLLSDKTIGLATPTTEDVIREGFVGRLFGIDIYSSNNVPAGTSSDNVILTHPNNVTEAMQINNMEALRSEKSFKDLVRALSVSGRKAVIPEAIIVASVKYDNEE